MVNMLIILVVALVVGLAAGFVFREKRKGRACVGCPYSGSCHAHGNGCTNSQQK